MDNMMPEFLSFGIVPGQNEVTLIWNVDRIIHNDLMGFKIYRHNNSGFVPAETNLITTLINQHSSFTDNSVQAGQNYFYMIEAVDDAGNSGWTTELSTSITSIKNEAALPTVFALEQNYPNPFNPSTMISYSIPQSSFVTLKVYDILGNEITTLVNETRSAGKYEVRFDASELSNGVYFYTVNADNFTSTKKMLLMK
ncbi:MAG: T9SS type A sorting domain-containing protein [Ignavibacteriales bacterium]|nr:T9SS type A sorting domain-containing protein [Ignavibacteriales bacterium]